MNQLQTPAETPDDLQKNLAEINVLLSKIEVHRRRQIVWTWIGLAALLLIAMAFVANLYLIGKKFDIERLAEEMIGKSEQVLDSRAVQQLRQDFHKVFLPACQEELAKEFERRLPDLRGSIETQTAETEDFSRVPSSSCTRNHVGAITFIPTASLTELSKVSFAFCENT